MSEQDWQVLTNSLSTGIVERAATEAVEPPTGGGTHMFVMNSLQSASGGVGLFYNRTDFAPAAKGASARGVVKRVGGAQVTGFSPFLFVCLGGTSCNDKGYLLGLEDADPYRIVLTKGSFINGIPEALENAYLRRSNRQYRISDGAVHHIRLDAIQQPNGDVVLKVMENDLDSNAVSSPVWSPVDGMSIFVDDAVGLNSYAAMGLMGADALPYSGGYMGMGSVFVDQVAVACAFDYLQFRRQV